MVTASTKQEQKRKALAQKFYHSTEKTFIYLYERWQNEKEYEDINEYATPLLPHLGCTYQVIVTNKEYLYKRIA